MWVVVFIRKIKKQLIKNLPLYVTFRYQAFDDAASYQLGIIFLKPITYSFYLIRQKKCFSPLRQSK